MKVKERKKGRMNEWMKNKWNKSKYIVWVTYVNWQLYQGLHSFNAPVKYIQSTLGCANDWFMLVVLQTNIGPIIFIIILLMCKQFFKF